MHCTPSKKVDNEHAKSSCAPPNQYKAMLCTTKVYVGTELHCEPWFACSLITTKILYLYMSMLVNHLCMFIVILPVKSALGKCQGWPPLLPDIGPSCAQWCTTQVSGAQRRSVVHSVVMYPRGGAQRSSHKPTHTNKHYLPASRSIYTYMKTTHLVYFP